MGNGGGTSVGALLFPQPVNEKYECQHCNYANIFRTPIICHDSQRKRTTETKRERTRRR